jgi:aspartyl/asparaginyl-tRNA synthetase
MPHTAADTYDLVGRRLHDYQTVLDDRGTNLAEEIERRYLSKWRSEALCHVLKVRTALVTGMQEWLVDQGLLNLERVSMSLLTDPLCHDVEHLPRIPYRQSPYVATHSMIYAKFMACHNPHLRGIFVDSPNIRLELPDRQGRQRGRYLLDFSQLDVEVRRRRVITLEEYLDDPAGVTAHLRQELRDALNFFEGMARAGMEKVRSRAALSLDALGVRLDLPAEPFPVYFQDETAARFGAGNEERGLGEASPSPMFFVVGLLRENYDLVYPYLRPDGTRRDPKTALSREIFNYDLLMRNQPLQGAPEPAREVLSGGLREWLPEAIIPRLLDNGVIPEAPRFQGGRIENIEALGGYAPFLTVACARDQAGRGTFPPTFGAGIGVERLLWALLRGPQVSSIDDVTFFGKNPDSAELFLF